MSNPWTQFSRLIAPGPKTIATVTTVNADGTSTVTLRTGNPLRVQGDTVAEGGKAIIQGGKIIGKAPGLEHFEVGV